MAQTGPVRIGTRGSRLALWQAGAVRDALAAAHALPLEAFEIVSIRTSGDRIQDRALAEVGGKGLFSKEIEEALLSGAVDLAVHSAKDMETFLPAGLMIAATLEREDIRDALISREGLPLDSLPRGARLGTASLRREALVRRRPAGSCHRAPARQRPDAAEARRGRRARRHAARRRRAEPPRPRTATSPHICRSRHFHPLVAKGAVAVECRVGDTRTRDMLASIDHRDTAVAVACERAFLAALDGSCRTPVAGTARLSGGALQFHGVLLSPDGQESYEADASGGPAEATDIGRAAGLDILRRAPASFLARIGIGTGNGPGVGLA
jgi:hydroxymethylbilane synthase